MLGLQWFEVIRFWCKKLNLGLRDCFKVTGFPGCVQPAQNLKERL